MSRVDKMPKALLSTGISVAIIGAFAIIGGWMRRWISDDGLIVLRTVRNIVEGNGPVFNAGERVEANTSTLWQYLITGAHLVTGADLTAIALYLALGFSVAALMIGAWATASVYLRNGIMVAPAGALVYIALPPARDFFTSGLEWGLSICYLAILWWLMVRWARGQSLYLLAFWCGLSWLVRPELALYGGIVGIVLFIAHRNWKTWLAILAVALPLPAAYQIFRMGYYGLLTPHTAVAKSASDSAWGAGFRYFADFVGPYWLWLPMLMLFVAAVLFCAPATWRQPLRSQTTNVCVIILCAVLHLVYVLRVGGDFMHGRMLLLPLFAVLLPVMVLPLKGLWESLVVAVIAAWAAVIAWRGNNDDWEIFEIGGAQVVDEREYWTYATQRAPGDPPVDEADYRNAKFLNGYDRAIEQLTNGAALSLMYLDDVQTDTYDWLSLPRAEGAEEPPTIYLVNLGMASAYAPLEVRVLDNIGLSTPIAARQPRVEDGRIGHDKNLARTWQAAESGVDLETLPEWVNQDEARRARQALQSEDFQKLFASYKAPLTAERFVQNLKFALTDGRNLELSSDPGDYLK